MRIHSDVLTPELVEKATHARGMKGVAASVSVHGSRSRKGALEVKLTGTSARRPNGGTSNPKTADGYAATWDEWGMFLAHLLEKDPDAIAGPYEGESDFHWQTDWRFEALTAPYQHPNHKWEYSGIPREFNCTFCEAVKRHRA